MKGSVLLYLWLWCAIMMFYGEDSVASDTWRAPLDTTAATTATTDSVLTLDKVLQLTAARNPILKALGFERQASLAAEKQAGLWSNPEFEFELEEFAWDAPGLKESELTFAVAQELELFGQRGARKHLARAESQAMAWDLRVTAFDLYLEVKRHFYELVHAQQQVRLAQTIVDLAQQVVTNIDSRISKGAALQSESLLASLELQRARLSLDQAQQDEAVAAITLSALWSDPDSSVAVSADAEPDLAAILQQVLTMAAATDSLRPVAALHHQTEISRAAHDLSAAESRPGITLSGGVKHLTEPGTNSFLMGISLPLPLFNRNQGERAALSAELRSLSYRVDQARVSAVSELKVQTSRLRQLINRHDTLDSLLLPTAERVYENLGLNYESGRLPYVELLEARRLLYELSLEHNDLLLDIHGQIIELEGLTGSPIRSYKEN